MNSIMCQVKATNREQMLIKLQMLNMIELIGSGRVGIYCLDLFEISSEVTLKVE